LKAFLDDESTLEERIESFKDEHNKMYILIKDAQWLQTSHQKKIYIYGDVLALMKKERTNSDYNIIYQISHTVRTCCTSIRIIGLEFGLMSTVYTAITSNII